MRTPPPASIWMTRSFRCQRRGPSKAARDDAAAQRLWQLSEELTGLTPAPPAGT
jgi:hypothetical protein